MLEGSGEGKEAKGEREYPLLDFFINYFTHFQKLNISLIVTGQGYHEKVLIFAVNL